MLTRSFTGIDLGTTYSCVGYVFELSFLLELPSHKPIFCSTPHRNRSLSLVLRADACSRFLRALVFSEPDE